MNDECYINDGRKCQYKVAEVWIKTYCRGDIYACSLLEINPDRILDWLVKEYEGGSEIAKDLLLQFLRAGVSIPCSGVEDGGLDVDDGTFMERDVTSDGYPYPRDLLELADYPVCEVYFDKSRVTTRTERNKRRERPKGL